MDASNNEAPVLRKRPSPTAEKVPNAPIDTDIDVKPVLPIPPNNPPPSSSSIAKKEPTPSQSDTKTPPTWDFNELKDIFNDLRAQLDTAPPPRRYGFTPLEQWRIYGTFVFYFNMIPLFFLGVYTIFVCGATVISAVFIQGSLVILGTFISLPFFVAMSVVGLAVGMVIVVIGHFFETETLKKHTPRFLTD
uniref:PRA1 family protein n=1 Tax=Panagrellus redivivus TaxID=6233 RepID=A0A7E4VAD3_PANRE